MEASSSVPLLNHGLQQYQWTCPSSDSEFYSISSPETVSPVPSVDYSTSPPCYYQSRTSSTTHRSPAASYSLSSEPHHKSSSSCFSPHLTGPGRKTNRTKTRVRSKQRESASEKEKLRMRDLTKALHHLRSYLPPSLVPTGQTLTKIDTLRLTIRYISYLSAQLGLTPSDPACETSPEILGYLQCSSVIGPWAQDSQRQEQYPEQCPTTQQSQLDILSHPAGCSSPMDLDQYSGQYSGQYSERLQGDLLNSSMDAFLQYPQTKAQATSTSSQMYGIQLIPNEYWG